GRTLIMRAGSGWSAGLVGQVMMDVETGSQAGFTLPSGGPVLFDDVSTETRFSPSGLTRDHGVVAGVSVIIDGTDRPVGVVGAHGGDGARGGGDGGRRGRRLVPGGRGAGAGGGAGGGDGPGGDGPAAGRGDVPDGSDGVGDAAGEPAAVHRDGAGPDGPQAA